MCGQPHILAVVEGWRFSIAQMPDMICLEDVNSSPFENLKSNSLSLNEMSGVAWLRIVHSGD